VALGHRVDQLRCWNMDMWWIELVVYDTDGVGCGLGKNGRQTTFCFSVALGGLCLHEDSYFMIAPVYLGEGRIPKM
jgi:hypothetical protein